jgi:hypothetical protein
LSHAQERQPERRLERPSNAQRDNRFDIDHRLVPPGMTMEWKRVALLGQEDRRNQVVSNQFHWKPVPHEAQPQILGFLGDQNPRQPVVVDGLMLMMRPSYLTEEAHNEREDTANYTIAQQLQTLRGRSNEEVGTKNTKFKREFTPAQPVE